MVKEDADPSIATYYRYDKECDDLAPLMNPLIIQLNGFNFVIPPAKFLANVTDTDGTVIANQCNVMIAENPDATKATLGDPFFQAYSVSLNAADSSIHAKIEETSPKQCLYQVNDDETTYAEETCSCFGVEYTPTEPSSDDDDDDSSVGLILGIIGGVILVLVLIAVGVYCYKKRQAAAGPGESATEAKYQAVNEE